MNAMLLALTLTTLHLGGPSGMTATLDGPSSVTLSTDVGYGQVDGRSAASVQPRLALERRQARLVLSVPIWLGVDGAVEPLANWNDPESWMAAIEELTYQTREGDFELSLGTLRHFTLGRGALVDAYGGRLDPLMPRTGAVVRLNPFQIDTQIFLSSIVAMEVVGGSAELAPLSYLGWDPNKRFRISWVGAADLSAPAPGQSAIFGGMSLGAGIVVWRSANLGFELYADGVAVGNDRRGVHMGLLTEWSRDVKQSATLAVKTELVMAEGGYSPGYFDVAYETERHGTVWTDPRGKLMDQAAEGQYARASVELGLSSFQLGVRGDAHLESRSGQMSTYGRYKSRHWNFTAMMVERRFTQLEDLLSLDASKAVVAEGAARIWGDFFASGRFFRGWQKGAEGIENVTAWSLGLGYGFRGVFR